MATVVRAEAKITAQNALRPGLNSAIGDLKRFRAQSEQLAKHRALEDRMAGMGTALTAAVSGFAAYQGLDMVRRAMSDYARLDREMTRIGITGDNASQADIAAGLKQMRQLALETAMPVNNLKDGMAALTSAGLNFKDSLAMLPAVAKTAQASGATTQDIANSSLALIRHLGVEMKDLQKAQDMMTRGGELGQFELKDMARYLPSMAPAAKAVGMEGTKGLARLVAMLQVIREGTGTAEEAASAATNVFMKMESEETAKKFKKMGVDLRKEMAKARKNGDNLLDTFVRLSDKALKGDISKVPQLFSDTQMAIGMRALLAGYGKMPELIKKINDGQGAVDANLKRITGDTQAGMDRVKESADRAKQALGGMLAEIFKDNVSNAADNFQRIAEAIERMRDAAKEGGALGALGQAAKDFSEGLKADLKKREDALQEEADDQTLANMPKRAALANQHARRHVRVNEDAISKLEAQPPSKDRDEKLAVLRRNLAEWRAKSANEAMNAEEQAAFSRDQQRRNPPPPVAGLDPKEVEGWREQVREANRARGLASPEPPAKYPVVKAPLPPARPDVGAVKVPVIGFDEAEKKTSALKEGVDGVTASAHAPGPALSGSIASGVDQSLSHLARLRAELDALGERKPVEPMGPMPAPQGPMPAPQGPTTAPAASSAPPTSPPPPRLRPAMPAPWVPARTELPDLPAPSTNPPRFRPAMQTVASPPSPSLPPPLPAAIDPKEGAAARKQARAATEVLMSPPAPSPPAAPKVEAERIAVPAEAFQDAIRKAESLKTTVDDVATAARAPGPAIAASVASGVDQAISHVDRLQAKLNSLRMPNISTMSGFPTGQSMAEVE